MRSLQTVGLAACLVLSCAIAAHCAGGITNAKRGGQAKTKPSSRSFTASGPTSSLTIPFSMTKLVLESTPNLQGLRKGNFDWVVTEMHPAAADATDAAVQPLTVLRVQHPDTEDTVAILELPFYSLPLSSNFMAYQFVTDFKPPFLSELIPKSADVRVELGKLFRRKDYPKLTKENAHKVHLSYNCQIVVSQMYEGVLFAFWYDEQLKKLHGSPVYNSRREKQLKQKAMRSIIARDYEIGLIFFNADDPRFKLAIKTFEGWFGTQFYGWH